ncbi:MAG: hypothetical protein QXR19_02235 [Candidatus Jordarchaeaceae archaeon]
MMIKRRSCQVQDTNTPGYNQQPPSNRQKVCDDAERPEPGSAAAHVRPVCLTTVHGNRVKPVHKSSKQAVLIHPDSIFRTALETPPHPQPLFHPIIDA